MANKLYEVQRSLQEDFITDVKNGNVSDVSEWIDSVVDNACIYTSDCYEIMHELMICDFEDYIANFGEVTNISGLAYFYLRENLYEEFNITEFEEMIQSYERYEEIKSEMIDLQGEIDDLDEDEDNSDLVEERDNLEEELKEVVEFLNDFGFEIEVVEA